MFNMVNLAEYLFNIYIYTNLYNSLSLSPDFKTNEEQKDFLILIWPDLKFCFKNSSYSFMKLSSNLE